MGAQITKRVGEIAKRLKSGDLEPVMRRVSKYLVSSAVGKINGDIPPRNASWANLWNRFRRTTQS